MSKYLLVVVALLVGSLAVHKVAAQTNSPANSKLPSDAEMRKAGLSDKEIESLKVVRNEKWLRSAGEDAMEGTKQVAFTTYGQAVLPSQVRKQNVSLTLLCGQKDFIAALETGPVLNGNIRLKFDSAPVITQNWLKDKENVYSRQPKALFRQILNAKTFKMEFVAPDASPQIYVFKVLDLKELMAKEPLCRM